MSKIVFRNHSNKAVYNLLKEVGEERYYCALKDAGEIFLEQKPISLHGFYFEYETDTGNIELYYRYTGGSIIRIMPVLGFWAVPYDGWEMVRKEVEKS